MSHYDQHQVPVAYPAAYPPPAVEGCRQGTAPPPIGYPTNACPPQHPSSIETTTRGDGFWKGCFAALCCCCVLDACF
ncbi:hypothetical protein RJ640_005011 [Escallonia rubra]|uniref:Cysteine-rich transmembrane domain-containing protein n=1 Tax=Escallonia rubra TaxID=112253 RepID=A0AA88QWK1_9ASTE|nr:hypothetical protein RJ640_005011 [Escallonia rubra]